MARETYLTPEQAAKAFVEGAYQLRGVQLLHLDSQDQWAAAEVTGVDDDGSWTHRVFLQHVGVGWTVRGGCGAQQACGGGWVRAPERGEAGYDGRNGVAAFSLIVPPDVQEIRVAYRTRRLSFRRRLLVPADGGRAFVAVWCCDSSWGVTAVEAKRHGHWELLDHNQMPHRFKTIGELVRGHMPGRRLKLAVSNDRLFAHHQDR